MSLEIEQRFILLSPKIELLRVFDKNRITFLEKIEEIDIYFNGPSFIKNNICLRIRNNNKGITELTYKGASSRENQIENLFLKEELNVFLKDHTQINLLIKIMNNLGFETLIEVKKDREIFIKDKLIFSVDKVNDCEKYFLEIEVNSYSDIESMNEIVKILKKRLSLEDNLKPYRDICLEK